MKTLDVKGVRESEYNIIDLPPGIQFPHGTSNLLITNTYKVFWDLICEDDRDWQKHQNLPERHLCQSHATIITGQPGIGMLFSTCFPGFNVNICLLHREDRLSELCFNPPTSKQNGYDLLWQ